MKKRDILRGVMADLKADREARDDAMTAYITALVAVDEARRALAEREKECEAALESARSLVTKRDLDAVRKSTAARLAEAGTGADHGEE